MAEGEATPPEKRGRGRVFAFIVALLLIGGFVLVQTGIIPFGRPEPRPAVVPQLSGQAGGDDPADASVDTPADTPVAEAPAGAEPAPAAVAAGPGEEAAAEPEPAQAEAPADAPAEAPESAAEAAPAAAEPAELAPAAAEATPAEAASAPQPAAAEVAAPASSGETPAPAPSDAAAPGTPPAPDVAAAVAQGAAEAPSEAPDVALATPGDSRPASEAAAPTPEPEPAEGASELPRFDIIRIDSSGAGVVAGRAQPGSTVVVMLGSKEIATAEVGPSGEFVAFVQTPASDEGQVLSLIARSGEEAARGVEDVLVLPTLAVDAEQARSAEPTIVKADDEGVRVVQPSALGRVDGVTLDSISYDATGAVRLDGRAPGAQRIRVYVDGNAAGAAESSAAGVWSATLTGIEEGRYVLRVDALRPDGSVQSRAESPFQRVYPTAEQRASATQITVQPGNTLWVMARERYGRGILYTQIFAANREAIRDPDLIYPGQIFTLPSEEEFTP